MPFELGMLPTLGANGSKPFVLSVAVAKSKRDSAYRATDPIAANRFSTTACSMPFVINTMRVE